LGKAFQGWEPALNADPTARGGSKYCDRGGGHADVGGVWSACADGSHVARWRGCTAVVDEFAARLVADPRINKFFATTDMPKLKMHLVDQICEASGWPCQYTGRSMKEAHRGLGVSTADFNALVEDLSDAPDTFKVGEWEKNQLLSMLGAMKAEVVENP
jgi:hemoglobin